MLQEITRAFHLPYSLKQFTADTVQEYAKYKKRRYDHMVVLIRTLKAQVVEF